MESKAWKSLFTSSKVVVVSRVYCIITQTGFGSQLSLYAFLSDSPFFSELAFCALAFLGYEREAMETISHNAQRQAENHFNSRPGQSNTVPSRQTR